VSAHASLVASQATDPNANTPAGVLYAIPLDSARADAQPRLRTHAVAGAVGGTGPSGGAGAGNTTPPSSGAPAQSGGGVLHTQGRSVGPSSGGVSNAGRVAPAAAADTAASGEPILVPGGTPGSLVHSSNGFGSSSEVPGYDAPISQGFGALRSGSGSGPLLAIVLSVLTLLAGVFFGAQAWRPRNRGSTGAGD